MKVHSSEPIQRSESELQCQSNPDNVSTTNVVLQVSSPNHTPNNSGDSLKKHLFISDSPNQHVVIGKVPTEADVHLSAGKAFMLEKVQSSAGHNLHNNLFLQVHFALLMRALVVTWQHLLNQTQVGRKHTSTYIHKGMQAR